MPKKKLKRAPKPKKEIKTLREVPQLDVNEMFEEIISGSAEPEKKKRRRRKRVTFSDVDDSLKIELIHRIEQIYKMNKHEPWENNLRELGVHQLRTHLNRLQWGHIPYITKEQKFPVIDEYPEDGFCCKVYGFDLWVNESHCQRRSMYPELYVWCHDCSRRNGDGKD